MTPTADMPPIDDHSANPHYLGHVVATGQARGAVASEDIVAGNGIKLLAKGAAIDASMRERLLEHKLRKPLEECIQVVDGIVPKAFASVAEGLLDRHALLRVLCNQPGQAPAGATLVSLPLPTPVQSLLTTYVDMQRGRLDHTVGVALLALGLSRRLLPGEPDRHRTLAMAGLLHDIGELYLDPSCLDPATRLDPPRWRAIASHPAIGHRVLLRMAGAGRAVAEAVRDHHERLDGYGYPRGVAGRALPFGGQLLAAAEWLMAMVEHGETSMVRIDTVSKLIQGEFSPEVLDLVRRMATEIPPVPPAPPSGPPDIGRLLGAATRIERLMASLGRVQAMQARAGERSARGSAALRRVLEHAGQRLQRIQTAFASTGLTAGQPLAQLQALTAVDAGLLDEIEAIVRELGWRLREIERTSLQRAGLMSPADLALMQNLIEQVKAAEPAAADAD